MRRVSGEAVFVGVGIFRKPRVDNLASIPKSYDGEPGGFVIGTDDDQRVVVPPPLRPFQSDAYGFVEFDGFNCGAARVQHVILAIDRTCFYQEKEPVSDMNERLLFGKRSGETKRSTA
jgi:hypothetical protein